MEPVKYEKCEFISDEVIRRKLDPYSPDVFSLTFIACQLSRRNLTAKELRRIFGIGPIIYSIVQILH